MQKIIGTACDKVLHFERTFVCICFPILKRLLLVALCALDPSFCGVSGVQVMSGPGASCHQRINSTGHTG